jgi:choline dehydrogenase-like flavoprotein
MSRKLIADTAILGSGFAAYEVARGLMESSRSIVVIERGGRDFQTADAELSRVPFRREPIQSAGIESGANVPKSFDRVPRYIGLGGTSELWSGKWRPLDAIDFRREHEGRKWLVDRNEIEPDFGSVRAAYRFPSWATEAPAWGAFTSTVAQHGLRLIDIYVEEAPTRLQTKWANLEQVGRVAIVCSTALNGAIVDRGKIAKLELEAPDGELSLYAREIVIACGGIESAVVAYRLLSQLAPDLTLPRFPGFMDHPKGNVGRLTLQRNREFLEFIEEAYADRRLIALSLPEDELKTDAIGNHTVFFHPTKNRMEWQLVINLEQFPEQENFLQIGRSAQVSWRISRATWMDMERFLVRFADRVHGLLGPIKIESRIQLRGASHHAGTLPMGPKGGGIVDADCRFYGLKNLYCVSSAVFPIAGSANPTMTISALSRRLARHLRCDL